LLAFRGPTSHIGAHHDATAGHQETIVRIRKTRAGREPPAGPDADHAMTALYQTHYRSLVQLAVLLVSDLATAEDIVQDSFAAVYDAWPELPDASTALCHLRRSVVRRSRSAPPPQPAGGSQPGLPPVVSALRALPARQREVLVLRYFADLPEAEIALVTGTRKAAVRSYAAQAMSSLRAGLPAAGG
jgi:DNA-directed RNA polymerase specialized sigma24 family protein